MKREKKERHALNTLLILLFLFHAVSCGRLFVDSREHFLNKLSHRTVITNQTLPGRAASLFRQSSKSTQCRRIGSENI